MKNKVTIIKSLGEYTDCIRSIAEEEHDNADSPPILWFRGLSDVTHSLVPSLFRGGTRVDRVPGGGDYSALHYAEDIRTQHYIAKNYHFLQKEPSSRVEWLEVMQHHRMNTRVMDWSESSIHSLLFAIEPFLDKDAREKRQDCVPCVWVLEPGKLNKKIFMYLKQESKENGIVDELLSELAKKSWERRRIFKIMERMAEKIYNETEETSHIDYIFNLSSINDEILRDRNRIRYLLEHGDVINPFYYILGRIYSDGHILKDRVLPPLAVVHPYHSERIKAQKGVFTVFPFYEEQKMDAVLRKADLNPDAMEHNWMAEDCLHQIVINNVHDVAYELLLNGMNDSWLYPEMPIVSQEIERHKVYS